MRSSKKRGMEFRPTDLAFDEYYLGRVEDSQLGVSAAVKDRLYLFLMREPPSPDRFGKYSRLAWWVMVPVRFLPESPPSHWDEPFERARLAWWLRAPVDRLPDDPPTFEDEPCPSVRVEWWLRVPVDRLPVEFPSESEPYEVCRHTWEMRRCR